MSKKTQDTSLLQEEETSRQALLSQLDRAVQSLIEIKQTGIFPDTFKVGDWSIKDILAHIAFWHESFARNARALADGQAPKVLSGTFATLNMQAMEQARHMSESQIIERIRNAQEIIQSSVSPMPASVIIPYRKGSRSYSPDEHLVVTRDHILAHIRQINKAHAAFLRKNPSNRAKNVQARY